MLPFPTLSYPTSCIPGDDEDQEAGLELQSGRESAREPHGDDEDEEGPGFNQDQEGNDQRHPSPHPGRVGKPKRTTSGTAEAKTPLSRGDHCTPPTLLPLPRT